jgi:small GTP-binding protein
VSVFLFLDHSILCCFYAFFLFFFFVKDIFFFFFFFFSRIFNRLSSHSKKYRLQIWDTAGQERFRTMTSSFYRGAQGVLVVYDPTVKESFTCARRWFDEVERNACEELVQMLVCNKVDLKARTVTPQEGSDSAAEMGVLYQECSAKENANIDAMFEELLTLMLEATTEVVAPSGKVDLGAGAGKKKKRCLLL